MSDDPAMQLLNRSPFGVIAVSGDLQVRGWNHCAAEIFAIDEAAAIGRDLADVLPNHDWRAHLATDGAAAQTVTHRRGGAAIVCDVQHQPHNGGHLLFVRDITARHARTMQYRRQEHLLRAIVDNLDIVVWAIDPDGLFNYQEGKALATAGLRPGQFVGQDIFALYGAVDNQPIRDALAGAPAHNTSSAHGMHWETWYIPVRDEEGAVTGCAGVTMDVTAARTREHELQTKLDVIEHQQRLIRGLSTPIIEVWDSVLTVPMIGLIDATRTADLMDNLLQAVSRTRARFAVLDLTGIDALDTASASALVRLIHAVRLLGAEGIVTGIHPSVAQTLVALGVDLQSIPVHADLRSALGHCIARLARR